jgi:hypothetical protein
MNPAPRPYIPRRAEGLDAGTFRALTGRTDVTAVQIDRIENGTALRARIAITGSPDLPARAFVKLAPVRPAERLLNRYMALAQTEALIYRQVNAELAWLMPKMYGAHSDPRTSRAIIIIEDLLDRDARFLSVQAGCTASDALTIAAALGDFHRRFWMSDRLLTGDLVGLSPAMSRSTSRGPRAWPLLRVIPARFHDVVPASFRSDASILVTQRRSIAALIGTYPHSLIHGDTHVGNVCFASGEPVLFDWQVASCGPAVKDLAYFACTSLDIETRREIDGRLVETYLAHLNADGVQRLSFVDAWDSYRLFAFTGYIAAGVTSVFGRRLQSEESTRAGLRRAVQAVRDLGSLQLLRNRLDRR